LIIRNRRKKSRRKLSILQTCARIDRLFENPYQLLEGLWTNPLLCEIRLRNGRDLLTEGRSFLLVEDADRYLLPPLLCFAEGRDFVIEIVFSIEMLNTLFVPLERIDPIERDAGLLDVDQSKSPVTDALVNQVGKVVDIARKSGWIGH
jgi:hypothetical protein